MAVADQIHERLDAAFSPRELRVVDESEKHRGHAGYREGGESHFQVTIAAEAFKGMSRIARHRAIHEALGKELVTSIHALGISASD